MVTDFDALAFPDDVRYVAATHEWARLEDGICTLGISDYAQSEIGDVVYVEAPEVGDTIEKDGEFGVIESVKSAFDLYSPVAGEVVETNAALEEAPELVNEDPFGAGWMVRIRVADPADIDAMLDAEAYKKAVRED
jgi:glycine cleavage system H protein